MKPNQIQSVWKQHPFDSDGVTVDAGVTAKGAPVAVSPLEAREERSEDATQTEWQRTNGRLRSRRVVCLPQTVHQPDVRELFQRDAVRKSVQAGLQVSMPMDNRQVFVSKLIASAHYVVQTWLAFVRVFFRIVFLPFLGCCKTPMVAMVVRWIWR